VNREASTRVISRENEITSPSLPVNSRFIMRREFFGALIYDSEVCDYIPFDKEAEEIFLQLNTTPWDALVEKWGNRFSPHYLSTFIKLCQNSGIVDSRYRFTPYILPNTQKSGYLSAPIKIHLQLTKACSLNCIYCFSNSGTPSVDELTTEEIFKLIDDMSEIGCYYLSLGGGEPLLREDLSSIIRYANQKKIAVSLSTNATVITTKMIEELKEVKLRKLKISFPGASQKSYDFLRNKNAYKRAIKGIALLKEHLSTPIFLHSIISKYNISELPSLVRLAESLEVGTVRFDFMLPVGRAFFLRDAMLSPQEALGIRRMAMKLQEHTSIRLLFPSIPFKTKRRGLYKGFGCIGGTEVCFINSQGFLYPCGFLEGKLPAFNIKKNSIKTLWIEDPSLRLMRNLIGNLQCKECEYLSTCRGGCRARALFTLSNLNLPDIYCPYYYKISEVDR